MTIGLGQRVTVRLAEVTPVTGGIALELLDIEGEKIPQGRRSPAGRSPRRKGTKAKGKKAATKRKVTRSRN
jgi:ribonuclease R